MPSKNVHELTFDRTDGDSTLWPTNTKRIVDSEGHVNYMQFVELDGEWALRWRKSVASGVATKLGLPASPEYILKSWPEGYGMYIHNKGPQDNPRTDKYLFGSKNANRFRSAPEFIPHAIWLMTDPTMTRANCGCKYCTKTPQRDITKGLGLSTQSSPASAKPRRAVPRPPTKSKKITRHQRVGPQPIPYAGIRRAPRPIKLFAGPKQPASGDRISDLMATFAKSTSARTHRVGEVVWCKLEPPVRSRSGEDDSSILFWPGVIEDVVLAKKVDASPSAASDTNMDVDMEEADSFSLPSQSLSSPGTRWKIWEWINYNTKLLGINYTYTHRGDFVLPYQAYGPSSKLLDALHAEISSGRVTEALEKYPHAEFSPFKTFPSEIEQSSYEQTFKFAAATLPFSSAIQIAAALTSYWSPTDSWEFKFTIPPAVLPEAAQEHTLDSAISASMLNPPQESIYAPPQRATTSRNTSQDKIESLSSRMSGTHLQTSLTQSHTQKRYQGLWWGTERIWTDELVRLKVARWQIAPDGSGRILPPAGPSKSAEADSVELEQHEKGAGGRGVFMKLEALFVVDPLRPGDENELRASGMLYELVDEDWEGEGVQEPGGRQVKSKGRLEGGGAGGSSPFDETNLDPALRSVSNRSSSLKAMLLSNPDPSVPIAETALDLLSKAHPESKFKPHRSPNSQLSNPGWEFPLPAPPTGYKFRAFLPPGYEAVISLSLISGRYYPGLLMSPLMRPIVEKACQETQDEARQQASDHLWALECLSPGVHNSVDPTYWKPDRKSMMEAADKEAQGIVDQLRETAVWGDDDIVMESI